MLGTIYLLRKVIVDEFICVHVAFLVPKYWIPVRSLSFDEVVYSPTPWFPVFPRTLRSLLSRTFSISYCSSHQLGLAVAAVVVLGSGMRWSVWGEE